MTIGVFCIIRERNRLSIDNRCSDSEEGARRHCKNIRQQIAYRFKSLVGDRVWSIANSAKNVKDNTSEKKFIKKTSDFSKSYGANNFLGISKTTLVPVNFEFTFSPIHSLIRPKNFNSNHRFHSPELGRTRSRTAYNSPPDITQPIPQEPNPG